MPGPYRDRIAVDRPTRGTIDPVTNEQLPGWEEFATVWGNVVALSSREVVRVRAAEMSTTHRVLTRYTPEITNEHRLRVTIRGVDHTLQIEGVMPINNRRELEMTAVEAS